MPKRESNRKKETSLVVGFNARPIAASAKKAGFRVLAVDYWGDTDLASSAEDVETVLKQSSGERPRRELSRPVSELLVECAEIISERHSGEVSFILVGSGLDDRPDLWSKLGEIAPVLGNSTKTLEIARNRSRLYETASKTGISSPMTIMCSSLANTLDAGGRIGYPVVLKPPGGGGGVGIKLVATESELRRLYLNEWRPDFGDTVFVQEYVRGENVSASVMGDGEKSIVVSVNEQLIGVKALGARTPFIWCGNVVPLQRSKHDEGVRKISSAAKALGDQLKLIGSNGFDFVLRSQDKVPVIIECNPRFQGTLECIEMATGINLVAEHVKACRVKMRKSFPKATRYAAKMIPFAKTKCVMSDLHGILGIRDVSPTGIVLEQGDPICTVHRTGVTKEQSIQRARESVHDIYFRLTLKAASVSQRIQQKGFG
jgi:predicted ATP-grasp superfamily ATP-dependent carboligase